MFGSGGDWKAAVLAVICAIIAFIIWFPFIKFYDNKLLNEEREKAAELASEKIKMISKKKGTVNKNHSPFFS